MKLILLILTFFFALYTFSQDNERVFSKNIIVKSNLLNLLALRPTLTIEKPFSKKLSVEISITNGVVNNFLFTDHYDYNGFLLRIKKYLDYGKFSPYVALYIGNLKRNIQTTGQVDNNGFFRYSSRDFSAISVRTGGSIGMTYIAKKKFVLDGLTSLGYGRYTKYYKPDTNSKGYLDCQIWLSIGYCF